MDCEKFENVMLDELYGELDELTSAAAKRHMAGCARCAALYSGLRATRRVAKLPVVEPPADLEARIFAATREAQKVVPLGGRVSRALSWAGSWAMRPQTAAAAVFMLMIGSSLFLVTNRRSASEPAAAVRVESAGQPAQAADEKNAPLDPVAAASAHGPQRVTKTLLPSLDPASPAEDVPFAADGLLDKDKEESRAIGKGGDTQLAQAQQAAAPPPMAAPVPGPTPITQNAVGPGGGAPKSAADDLAGGYGQGSVATGAVGAARAGGGGATAPSDESKKKDSDTGGFERAMGEYRARRFDDATRGFDALAGSDPAAGLWAARSVRESKGCAAALPRFDAVSARWFGTGPGYEATFDAGNCYRQTGQSELARARFSRLLSVQAWSTRAQEQLDQMAPKTVAKPVMRDAPKAPAAKATEGF
jgi:hypothetical protein